MERLTEERQGEEEEGRVSYRFRRQKRALVPCWHINNNKKDTRTKQQVYGSGIENKVNAMSTVKLQVNRWMDVDGLVHVSLPELT